MIAYLQGKPLLINQNLVIVAGGVGYGVRVSPQTLAAVMGQPLVELHVFTHVKEDKLDLYGFITTEEKETFELLLSVSGIGPATALALVAAGSHELVEAVRNANISFFTNIPRVGKKLAQKIIIELRGKMGELKTLDLGPKSEQHQAVSEALMGLGFAENHIETVLADLDLETLDLQTAIKTAIKTLGQNSKAT